MNKLVKSSNYRFYISGFLLLLLGVVIRLYKASTLELSYFDEGAYILEAAKMFNREPSVDYYYARPGYVFLLGLVRYFIEDPVLSGRLLGSLGFAITGILTLFPISRILGDKVALASLCYFSLMGLSIYYSRLIFPDAIVSALLLGALTIHVTGEEKKSYLLSLISGLFLGLTIVTGSYRIAPTLLGLGLVFLITTIQQKFEFGALKRLIVTLLPASYIIYLFNKNFRFFDQVERVLTASALTRDKNISKLQPDFLFFIVILALTTSSLVVAIVFGLDWFKRRKEKPVTISTNLTTVYFTRLVWALLLSPMIFHTFYYLRAPKVISTSLPALAIIMALWTIKIKNDSLRLTAFFGSVLISLIQCHFVLSGMGINNATTFYSMLSTLPGTVAYGNAFVVTAVNKVDTSKTKIVLGWDCEWRPESCNPDYSVVSPTAYEQFDEKEKSKWIVYDSWDLKLTHWGSLLYHFETYDSSPKTIMKSLNQQAFKEFSLPWLILKKQPPNK